MATGLLISDPLKIFGYLLLSCIFYKAAIYGQRLFFHPLSKFPGPTICAVSRLYEFYWDGIQHGRLWSKLPELHDKYGPIIRMGPDEIHIRDPEFYFYLFSFKPLDKWAFAARQYGLQYTMFGTEEHKSHGQRRAAFGDSFSRGRTWKMQPLVNDTIRKGCAKIEERTEKGESIDLAYLFRAIAAEIVTVWMYGQEYGFFQDEKTTMGLYDRRSDALFGVLHLGRFIPFWIPIILTGLRNKVRVLLDPKASGANIMTVLGFAERMLKKQIDEHGIQQEFSSTKEYRTAASVYLHSSLPQGLKAGRALTESTMVPWSGGWDNTAFALTTGTYYILKSNSVMNKLQKELESSWTEKNSDPDIVALDKLPYLHAVVHETLRLTHGALCRITRINRTAAEQYQNWTIPAGTKISMSLPDINLDKSIWGDDAAVFRPERWLPRRKGHFDGMEKYMVTFSRGTRACAGQDLAWMELKLIFATLFRRFDMRIDEAAGLTDDDILPWSDEFVPVCKTMMHWLPVTAKENVR